MRDRSAGAEIEVKLPCEDLERVRESLRRRGGSPVKAMHFESNDLYDEASGRLSGEGCALRLRRSDGKALLTFKGPARFEKGVKIREERETEIADSEQMEAILAALGLRRRFRYEKRREEWELERCTIALDQTPIGDFIEVEGDPAAIRRAVAALELDFASALPYSYARLYQARRRQDRSLPEDMVFAGREAKDEKR